MISQLLKSLKLAKRGKLCNKYLHELDKIASSLTIFNHLACKILLNQLSSLSKRTGINLMNTKCKTNMMQNTCKKEHDAKHLIIKGKRSEGESFSFLYKHESLHNKEDNTFKVMISRHLKHLQIERKTTHYIIIHYYISLLVCSPLLKSNVTCVFSSEPSRTIAQKKALLP